MKKTLNLCISIVLILGTIFISCQQSHDNQKINENYFTKHAKLYSDSEIDPDSLKGKIIVQTSKDAYNLMIVDTIICVATLNRESLFSLFSINGNHLVDFGKAGNDSTGFTSNRLTGQSYQTDGDMGIWVNDVNNNKLKRISLTRSLKDKVCIVDSIIGIHSMVKNAFIHNRKLYEEIPKPHGFNLLISSIDDYTPLNKEKLFKGGIGKNGTNDMLFSNMVLSPDARYLVMAMNYINEVNILNLKDYSRKTVSLGNVKKRDEVVNPLTHMPQWIYYGSVIPSRNYIISLYHNHEYDTPSDYNYPDSEVHVFDYDGNLKSRLVLDRYICALTYSENDNSIYGLDNHKRIIRYQLNP